MATLGLLVAVMSVCSMIVGHSIPSPWWLSAPANALVIFAGLYALRYTDVPGAASARPTLLSTVITGLLSIAAAALVVAALGDGTATYLIAGAAIAGVWMIGAWWVGRS